MGPPALPAQSYRFAANGGTTFVRFQRTAAGNTDEQSGFMASAVGTASAGPIGLELSYLEGQLRPQGSSLSLPQDLVEGQALLGLRPLSWVTLSGGPHARAFIRGGVTERWLYWEGRARAEAVMASQGVRGYVTVWHTLTGSVTNAAGAFGDGQGGEVGLKVRVPRSPVWLQMSYAIERARLAPGLGSDTVEGLTAFLGVGGDR
jgi:hypothetical protein